MWFIGYMIEKGEYRDEQGKCGNLGQSIKKKIGYNGLVLKEF